MSELLLEIFSAEIPARMQEDAHGKFANALKVNLINCFGISDLELKSWVTPRRLGIVVKNLRLNLNDIQTEIRGPKTTAPKAAIEGFLKKNNLNSKDIFVKDDYYFAYLKNSVDDPIDALKKVIINTIKNFVWPKSMRDGDHELRWVRPIQSILCLLDGKTLEFDYYHLKANNYTYGHRFLAPQKLTILNHEDYKKQLKNAFVILEINDRKNLIYEQIAQLLIGIDIKLIKDEALLSEIAGLVEYPVVFLANITPQFMKLPKEVLIIALKHHQRYLMTEDSMGNLAPYYLIVSNTKPIDDGLTVIMGNQKVLFARLSDAKFFYDQDLKLNLSDYQDQLKNLVFNTKIGSVFEKQMSVNIIALKLAKILGVDSALVGNAVMLAKCDLVTNMVKEFPELQGVMGYYYALAQGEHEDVALAIRDHYKPMGPNDVLPNGLIASVVAIADKLNTLNQMFAIGIKPTGSKDPYALRRAAIGLLRIIESQQFNINLNDLDIREDVIAFINERKEVINMSAKV